MNVSDTGLFFGVSGEYAEYKASCALPNSKLAPWMLQHHHAAQQIGLELAAEFARGSCAPDPAATSSNFTPLGWSSCSMQYTSGPRCTATRPASSDHVRDSLRSPAAPFPSSDAPRRPPPTAAGSANIRRASRPPPALPFTETCARSRPPRNPHVKRELRSFRRRHANFARCHPTDNSSSA